MDKLFTWRSAATSLQTLKSLSACNEGQPPAVNTHFTAFLCSAQPLHLGSLLLGRLQEVTAILISKLSQSFIACLQGKSIQFKVTTKVLSHPFENRVVSSFLRGYKSVSSSSGNFPCLSLPALYLSEDKLLEVAVWKYSSQQSWLSSYLEATAPFLVPKSPACPTTIGPVFRAGR